VSAPRGGVKLLFCLRRRADLTREEFQSYWHDEHGRLGVSLAGDLGYRRYVQSHTLSTPLNDALRESRGAPEPYDGVVELWFESLDAIERTFSGSAGRSAARALLRDERNFVDLGASPIFVVEERAMDTPADPSRAGRVGRGT
jgi:uncharacterized protein (TIGR02118 family)